MFENKNDKKSEIQVLLSATKHISRRNMLGYYICKYNKK